MTVQLNEKSYEHARKLIKDRKIVLDERDDWSEHQPTSAEENEFIRTHGFSEYERWHLGIDTTKAEDTKERYKFPYGDFKDVHRCAVLAAKTRSGQYKYDRIEVAAAHLHGMLDDLM
ncbi:hypothetical protein [Microvirga sp. 2TAF3]|uniref:hypothetical protein n=1 Tax=Microvirga sp. 2TAF3 TaxID=3233014 RepID=UPI003F94A6A5